MTIIGIDLGTTNTAAAFWKDGKAELIPNRYGEFLTPSVVFLDENERLIVGKYAKDKLKVQPQRAASVFKRSMGSNSEFTLGSRKFSATELSALVIKMIKDDAEKFLGEDVSEAIISVPAYFNDNQRKATKAAAEMAGLKVDRLINEPTAAAIAYGIHERPEDTRFMVLDLGGGTFDVSIMEYFDGVLEVYSSAGDNYLGGEDFLEACVIQYLATINTSKKELSPEQNKTLYAVLQKAVHTLSTEQRVEVPAFLRDDHPSVTIDRDEFNHWVQPLIDRMRTPMERALQDAKLNSSDLDQVVLVGGATRMPVISAMVARLFRQMPARNIDPDLVVAMGTGIQAGLCARDAALDDVVLTDVCPYTLGIATRNHSAAAERQGAIFNPIIERNSVVPISRVDNFYTTHDDQDAVTISIFQGESRLVKNNVFLGETEIAVPKSPAGEEQVDVRFSYDMNGLLEVDVKVLSTGENKSLVIDNSSQHLSEDEINASRNKLATLKFHPREDEINQQLLFRAERLFESALGDMRDHISRGIGQFEEILESQDPERVKQAQSDFSDYLEDLEKQSLFD